MGSFYVYLISSLPVLHFGMKPPFSFERFLELCKEFVPEEDSQILKNLPAATDYDLIVSEYPLVKQWVAMDTALRNELVKIRSSRKHIDAAKYLRGDGYLDAALAQAASAAQRSPSPLEAEKILDHERWRLLDELAVGNFFNLQQLITYAYKLKILAHWEKIQAADKNTLMENTLSNI
ncbi:MAG: hypothetical protein MUC39_00120 [Candidatus Omnitrophica bacterium]|jgi:hypothetical protein|nr:hypothetical protein [Candidatus Omnitrophota bacterium]